MNGIVEYFDGNDGYALHIKEYYKFVKPIKLKEIKCPCCNASIKLKENATKGICEYC